MRDDSNPSSDRLRQASAFLGAMGVALGAFGAHGLKSRLTGPKLENWKTAVFYQLFHAVAVLSVSVLCDNQHQQKRDTQSSRELASRNDTSSYARAGQCMALGSLIFSGSIYMLCLDVGPKKLWGPMTPIGGLFMIAGWTMLGLK
jgi:uncharacterized membrane protein YgdD (TMEM256/DUF423 family)